VEANPEAVSRRLDRPKKGAHFDQDGLQHVGRE